MGTKVKAQLPANVSDVFAVLTDAAFLEARTAGIGQANAKADVAVEQSDTGAVITKTVTVELENLPGFLKKAFDPKQVVQVREEWHAAEAGYKGEYEIHIEGQPVLVRGVFTLAPDGAACTYEVMLDCKAKIPLIGGQVSKFVLGQYVQGAKDELAYTQKHFA
ncbi:MAG: DUF2505 domain-containing protein [Alphaproteobacteria bacterium]